MLSIRSEFEFIRIITNGTFPEKLIELKQLGLVDYVTITIHQRKEVINKLASLADEFNEIVLDDVPVDYYLELIRTAKSIRKNLSLIKVYGKPCKNFAFLWYSFKEIGRELPRRLIITEEPLIDLVLCNCDAVRWQAYSPREVCKSIFYYAENRKAGNCYINLNKIENLKFHFCKKRREKRKVEVAREVEKRFYAPHIKIENGKRVCDFVFKAGRNRYVRLRYKGGEWKLDVKVLGRIWEEVSVKPESPLILNALLEFFEPHLIIDRMRKEIVEDECKIVFDEVKYLGRFVEIEGSEECIEKFKEKLNLKKEVPPYGKLLEEKGFKATEKEMFTTLKELLDN